MRRFFFFAILLVLFTFISYSETLAKELIIKAGTPIPVKLDETLSSETVTAGQTVRFLVTRDISVDNNVVLRRGAEVIGEVTHAERTGSFGKEGKLFLVIRHATAVDGTRVPLRSTLSQTGEEKVALSWMFCPFIKGTSTELKAGMETKAYVDYDTKVSIN